MASTTKPVNQWSEPANSGAAVRIFSMSLVHVGEEAVEFQAVQTGDAEFDVLDDGVLDLTVTATTAASIAARGHTTILY